ncbi:MAG: ABC transporter ATP-binding protein [Oscillospiraceae bacterium]
MALLEVNLLCKSFGGLAAVKDITISVPEHKVVSLIGPNGAGKTTVFNLLSGFYEKDSGDIVLDGIKLENIPTHMYIVQGMSRTFQNLRLFANMSVLENVLIGYQSKMSCKNLDAVFCTRKKRIEEEKAIFVAREALDKIGLLEHENEICSGLPYGMQKRLEIARALVSKPKVLLLDEPAAGLNPNETSDLSQFIRGLCDEGNTVFLIEHDMHLVMNISDYVYVMDHGEMLSEGPPQKVCADDRVIEAYFGKGGVQNAVER